MRRDSKVLIDTMRRDSKVFKCSNSKICVEVEAELFKQNPWWGGRFKEESHAREKYLSQICKLLPTEVGSVHD